MRLQAFLLQTRKQIKVLFSKRYLIYTNTGISGGLSVTGDIIQQKLQPLSQSQNCKRQKTWNKQRTAVMGTSGTIVGPLVHYWYLCLDKWFPGKCLRSLSKKVLVDQIIGSPMYVAFFLVCVGFLKRHNLEDLKNDFKNKAMTLCAAELIVWTPAQIVNFNFVPLRFRVFYDNIISLAMDTFYSYVNYSDSDLSEDF